ncbi:MAG TPA: NAD(P)H-binding protein [Flavobacteriales bacterium]|nr:NAD(P)H-binding protein [Flavobacteriales bacterium]HRP82016.1 NAD(P)H-binding protein [Flavobacteriales bacterium]
MSKTILLAGATGLVGGAVLPLLLADAHVGKVVALVRRPLAMEHLKLEQWVDEDLLDALRPVAVDAVICCLGTTIKAAGSQAAFIAVDKVLPLGIARWAKAQGVPAFCIISAMGADAGSRIFYSRVKGEVEQELAGMGFGSLALFQPSVLTGPRKERRAGEGIGSAVLKLLGPLLAGTWANYRVMPHDRLAKALVACALVPAEGIHRYRYRDILCLAR